MLKFKMGYPSAAFSSMRGVRISRDNTEERISIIPPQEGVVLRILSSRQHPYFEEVATSELDRDALLKKASYFRERFGISELRENNKKRRDQVNTGFHRFW
ncbi:hypothetical protein HYT84_04115 [Candidatus Micrarchaeota archaeon]|nr:hypothetical protein [Candidatus Micrarchaeota archaeon]